MRLFVGLVAFAALFCGFQLVHGGSQSAAGETVRSGVYRLTANGDEADCAVQRGAEVSTGLSLLSIAPNCSKLMPGIEQAKFWREGDDGTIAFSADGIDPIVTFSVADGDGYESYAPATPLLSLATAVNSDRSDAN